ncbi:MAG TPA: type II toxin-antitoxin system RelE/ParE family toxin [Verrucomicrobiae bacterium]|nr:type II toxin-antitoxin system RelE/ParE family toxin [Verrucomicrobiae bacterium]
MDYKIIFSEPAIDDLQNIVRFIARDDQPAAAKFGGKLIESVRHLATFPRIGRAVPEQNDPDIREIVFKPYRIFYRVKDETHSIEVIRFWHAAHGEPKIPHDLDL